MATNRIRLIALAKALAFAACASAAEPTVLKPLFMGGQQSNYQGNTQIAVGTTAGEMDFIVTCTQTQACETAWGILSQRLSLPASSVAYAVEFEIRADRDWIKPTTGQWWDNAISWFGADGGQIGRRRLSLEFRAGEFASFRFSGTAPTGAVQAVVQFGVDLPGLPPGEEVAVRNVRYTAIPAGCPVPSELIPDLRAPIVRSCFTSPSPDVNLPVVYEITDYTGVDWSSVVVTDAVTKATIPFTRTGDRITLRPSTAWMRGRHLVDIAARDVNGNAGVARKVFLIGESPKPPAVALRDDGMALVGGKPFFPIGIYGLHLHAFNAYDFDIALRDLKRAGLNIGHSYGHRFDPRLLTAANRNCMKLWTDGLGASRIGDPWFLGTGRADKSILAWYIGDDTSSNTTPGELLDRDEAVRLLDGTRITCHADGVRAKEAKSNCQEYVNFADVFMPEIYPIDGTQDEQCVAEVCRDVDRCWADIRTYGDGQRPRGVWPILQCFHGKGWKRYPTAQEMYAMSFAALIHGANGITWFTYGGEIDENHRYSGMFRTPEDWTAMTNITRRIATLAPVLLERTPAQPPVPEIVSGAATDPLGQPAVTLLLKRRGSSVFVLAVNAAAESVRARFRLGLRAAKGRVFWERREVALANGVFEDDFDAFGVHVYRFVDQR